MIFRSPYREVEIPEVALTEYVFRRAHEHADKPALIDGPSGRTITYGQLLRRSAHGLGLARRGFSKGDVLAILARHA